MLFSVAYLISCIVLFFKVEMSLKRKGTINIKKHGAGEAINFLIHYAGEKLGSMKEKIIQWLEKEEDELSSLAHHDVVPIARCIGAAAGLVSGDHWIDAQMDTTALLMCELLRKTDDWYKTADTKERREMKKKLLKEIEDYYLKDFEKMVAEPTSHLTFSWLHIFLVGAISALEWYLETRIIDGRYPKLLKLVEDVSKIPSIKAYIDSRSKNIEPEESKDTSPQEDSDGKKETEKLK